METLNQLVTVRNFEGFRALLTGFPRLLAPVSELIGSEKKKWTTLILHCLRSDSPLETVECICETMNDDPQNKSLFALLNWGVDSLLNVCANFTTQVDVLQFVIDAFPASLIMTKSPYPYAAGISVLTTAQDNLTSRVNHAAVVRCLTDNIARYLILLNQVTVKMSIIRMKQLGMTDFTAPVPLNDLTPGLFVFVVLDNLVNRGMKLMAEDIISYVGTNVGFTSGSAITSTESLLNTVRSMEENANIAMNVAMQGYSKAKRKRDNAAFDLSRAEAGLVEASTQLVLASGKHRSTAVKLTTQSNYALQQIAALTAERG